MFSGSTHIINYILRLSVTLNITATNNDGRKSVNINLFTLGRKSLRNLQTCCYVPEQVTKCLVSEVVLEHLHNINR